MGDLIESIADDFYDLNGIEASVNDIAAVFVRIKAAFAEEAIEDEEDYQTEMREALDSDYDENNWEDDAQYQVDLEDDYLSSDDEDLASKQNEKDEIDEIQEQDADKENKAIIMNLK